jgi:hypothetical protein
MLRGGAGRPRLGAAAFAALLLPAGTALAAETIEAVTTSGSGTLTMCRDWLVHTSCEAYHNVELPPRIAVGDKVAVTFGSNPKDYNFHVSAIRRRGDGCTILSEQSGADESGEKIEVSPCEPTAQPAAGR